VNTTTHVINTLSLPPSASLWLPGTEKPNKVEALTEVASKSNSCFLFRSMWVAQAIADLILIPFRPARGGLKGCFSEALLK
jgi:hypothetical protein